MQNKRLYLNYTDIELIDSVEDFFNLESAFPIEKIDDAKYVFREDGDFDILIKDHYGQSNNFDSKKVNSILNMIMSKDTESIVLGHELFLKSSYNELCYMGLYIYNSKYKYLDSRIHGITVTLQNHLILFIILAVNFVEVTRNHNEITY